MRDKGSAHRVLVITLWLSLGFKFEKQAGWLFTEDILQLLFYEIAEASTVNQYYMDSTKYDYKLLQCSILSSLCTFKGQRSEHSFAVCPS